MFFNYERIDEGLREFRENKPFDHCVIDGFFSLEIAELLEKEFLGFENPKWFYYKNPIEDKKTLNDWNVFPKLTYQVFREMISEKFIKRISEKVGVTLFEDSGLHGGGWHIHGPGGNLNPHLDYSIHPKIGLQRKINIIVYLSSDLLDEHGGHFGLWGHDADNNCPNQLEKIVQPKFNRAVIFDTTQNSWHGISSPLIQPEGIYRKSIAVYYLTMPQINADKRERALFAARDEQKGDKKIEEIIKTRADSKNYLKAYRTK